MTPVNTFRLILSQLFDTSLALRPDRSYASTLGRPYDFRPLAGPEQPEAGGDPSRD
jgi:hypothetical protein